MKNLLFVFLICCVVAAPRTVAAFDLTITTQEGVEIAWFNPTELSYLSQVQVETTTPWTDGVVRFTGVSAAVLLDAVAPEADVITAVALDNYVIDIPTEILRRPDTIIAYEMDGVLMRPSNKGPFWIVFNFDQVSIHEKMTLRNYSIWQLIEIKLP